MKLLLQAAPVEQSSRLMAQLAAADQDAAAVELSGPVVNPEGRTDVVANQGEVDDLLASLGF